MLVIRAFAMTAVCAAILTGCGGGGGGGNGISASTVGTSQAIVGVAATGAPLINATVTLTDANGATRSTTSNASGNYTLNVTGLVAPFVIVASGAAGDGTDTLVSVAPTAPASGNSATVNVTPLTMAIAAALDSNGDPLHLAANLASQAANITTTALNTAQTNLQSSLTNVLTALGLSPTTNFVNGTMVANGTGADQLLDSIQVNVAPGGTAGGGTTIAVKDGNGTVTSANLHLASVAATGLALTTPVSYSILSSAQSAISACFAVSPSASRSTASACTGLFTSDYLNNGHTVTQELTPFNDPAFDNAVAEAPEVVYFIDTAHAIVKLVLDLADGSRYALMTVAENSTNTGNTWKIRGDQRNYYAFANGMAQWVNQLNASAALPSAYTSGINLYFDATAGNAASTFAANNPNSYVLVTGPGLPNAGVVLKTSTGTCSYLTITSENGNTGAAHKNSCASYFRLTGRAVNPALQSTFVNVFTGTVTGGGTASPLHNQNYADGIVADATLQNIVPFSQYTIRIHDGNGNTDTTYTEYLRSRPLATTELPNVRWANLSSTSQGLLDPTLTTAFAGGTTIPLSWTTQAYAPSVGSVNVQIRAAGTLVATNPRVPPQSTSYTVNSATTWPAVTSMTATPSNSDFDWIGLIARNRYDLQIQSVNEYSME